MVDLKWIERLTTSSIGDMVDLKWIERLTTSSIGDGGLEVDREIDNIKYRRDGGLEVDREIAMRHQCCN